MHHNPKIHRRAYTRVRMASDIPAAEESEWSGDDEPIGIYDETIGFPALVVAPPVVAPVFTCD